MEPIVAKIVEVIVNPILTLMFILAILLFLWGIFRFVSNDEGATGREQGKQNMIWGVVGLLIMVSAYGIIAFIKTSLSL